MPMPHQSKIALVICLLLAIAGCTIEPHRVYDGPALPPEQTAIIKPTVHRFSPTHTYILEVDGKDFRVGKDVRSFDIAVLPGKHKITCTIIFDPFLHRLSARTFTIQAEAGHVYRVDGSYYLNHLWIVDETTGVEVAADRPEMPEPIEEHKPF